MTKCYGYVRVSTGMQADSGLGIEAQRAALEAEAARQGWDLEVVVDVVSGGKATDKRPALAAALDDLDAHGGVLVVSKLDRVSRSVLDFTRLLDRAQEAGWRLVCLDIAADTGTASGRMVVTVLAAAAELEVNLIRERTRNALQAKKARGSRLGAPVRLPESTRALVAALRADGLSLRAIAAELERRQVPTATGAGWHASTVNHVLRSLDLDAQAIEATARAAARAAA